ncbi:MAG: hypothetical protein PHV84_02710, partial [Eubacteriales bacterium]|nr:hypothetical protein [Eubacteriales bacterium]
EDALALIASNADGSVRDGLSLLDRCAAGNGAVTREVVLELLGMCGQEIFLDITQRVMDRQVGEALLIFDAALSQGKEVNQFARDWVEHFRSLLIIKYVDKPEHVLNLSTENIRRLQQQADCIPLTEIKRCIIELSAALTDAKWSPKPRVIVELAIVRMASAGEERPEEPVRKKPAEVKAPSTEIKTRKPEGPASRTPAPAAGASHGEPAEAELWRRVMEDERISKMARTCGSVLREISDHIFTVQISNSIQEEQFKKEEKLLEEILEENTGRRLRMHLLLKDAEVQESFI